MQESGTQATARNLGKNFTLPLLDNHHGGYIVAMSLHSTGITIGGKVIIDN